MLGLRPRSAILAGALALVLALCLLGGPTSVSVRGEKIADCCCELETVDVGNDEQLYQLLQTLRTFTFFRIFKVNLYSECAFWRENPQCNRINCAVCGECKNEDLPEPWRIPTTAPVDRTLMGGFKGWSERDDSLWIVQDDSEDMSYINMQLNPEGYTGYEGFAPHRIWKAIYEENCFATPNTSPASTTSAKLPFGGGKGKMAPPKEVAPPAAVATPASEPATVAAAAGFPSPSRGGAEFEAMCYEQRVLYRLLSGIHASISVHIASAYPLGQVDPSIDLHAPSSCALIGPNTTVFQERVGAHPHRMNNMYFAFVFLLRAVNKARSTLQSFDYSVGVEEEDTRLQETMQSFLNTPLVTACSSSASFDETLMFASASGRSLRTQLKGAFRNISRIMDCVGCEKCKLHGKLQVLGLATALKILFHEAPTPPSLERNEVMALLVTTSKLSHALRQARAMEASIRAQELEGTPLAPDLILTAAVTAFALALAAIAAMAVHVRRWQREAAEAEREAEAEQAAIKAAAAAKRATSPRRSPKKATSPTALAASPKTPSAKKR